MGSEVTRRDPPGPPVQQAEEPAGSVRRLGSAIGLVTIGALDVLALDDITTAGAWMPEIAFVIASLPALVVLAYYLLRPRPSPPRLPEGKSGQAPG